MKRRKRTPDFEIQVDIFDDAFVATPRPEQRSWIVNQCVGELAFELDEANAQSGNMLVGGSPAQMQGRETAKLSDQEIMEDWQGPVMQAMAGAICKPGGDILEIGFGRGVSSHMIQEKGVGTHTIVECNPHIMKDAKVWSEKYPDGDFKFVEGLWQDTVHTLGKFDGIFFHTYPLTNEELLENLASNATFAQPFFSTAQGALKPGGKFTYYTNEASSLSRAHQRALFRYFESFRLSKVEGLDIPQDSHDAHWFDEMVIVQATA